MVRLKNALTIAASQLALTKKIGHSLALMCGVCIENVEWCKRGAFTALPFVETDGVGTPKVLRFTLTIVMLCICKICSYNSQEINVN